MISLGFDRRWSVACTVPRQRGEKGGSLRRRLCKKINIEGDPRSGEEKKKNGRNRREEISLIRVRWLGLGVLSVFFRCSLGGARKRCREKTVPRKTNTSKLLGKRSFGPNGPVYETLCHERHASHFSILTP